MPFLKIDFIFIQFPPLSLELNTYLPCFDKLKLLIFLLNKTSNTNLSICNLRDFRD